MAALSAYVSQALHGLAADPKAAAAAVGGAAATYAGMTTMSYNKDNFITDQGNRFSRFTMARANMIAQVGQYRVDLRGMTGVTTNKAHVFIDTAQLFMCTSAALSCAGRIGMHGAAPPGWICALYTGNIFLGVMYLTVCLWMGLHSGLRAQCGMVSLLTRKVRLPIPSLDMINQARCFGSGYEKQKWWDILRFPWVPHPHNNPEIPAVSSDEEGEGTELKAGKKKKKSKAKKEKDSLTGRHGDYAASEAFGSTGRTSVPSWIRDEQVTDKGTAAVPVHEPVADPTGHYPEVVDLTQASYDSHEAPDHFKLFTEAQKEWFPYETYEKVALLFGVCCFFHAMCYYCIITAMSELRGFWIAWAVPGIFMTAQYWILQLDIFKATGQQYLYNFEWFGHVAPYLASAACTCEFRAQYSKAQVTVAWTFAMLALFSHLMFAVRFWDLMTPDCHKEEKAEEDGKSWWPRSFEAPLAFSNTLWQITPPNKLKKGQHDLLHEALNLERHKSTICKVRRRRGGKAGTGKPSKRPIAQKPQALMGQAQELENRFRVIWDNVVGKDQMHLTQLHGRCHVAKEKARDLGGGVADGSGSEGSGSGSGSDAERAQGNMKQGQYGDRIAELAEELNSIEDELADMERKHQVSGDAGGKYVAQAASGTEVTGTTEKGLPQKPYWMMRLAVGTNIFVWLFVMGGTSAEIILGPTAMMSPPGEPPWIRNQKMRVYQPGNYLHLSKDPLPSWYRLFVSASIPDPKPTHAPDLGGGNSHSGHAAAPASHGGSHGSTHGGHRRLDDQETSAAFGDLLDKLPSLDWLAQELQKTSDTGSAPGWPHSPQQVPAQIAGLPTTLPAESAGAQDTTSVPMGGFMTPALQALPVEWPPLFEPRHLACQTRSSGTAVAALTPRGFGALLHLKNSSAGPLMTSLASEQFALAGISAHAPLVGASWSASGLHLVSKMGKILHCPGHVPADGAWSCEVDSRMSVPLPPKAMLRAGAVSDHASGRMIALLYEDMPTTVVLYKEESDAKGWLPAGDVRLPPGSGHAGLAFAGEHLLVVAEDGAVHHRPLRDGVKPWVLPSPASTVPREWHSACTTSVGESGVVRLALRQGGPAWKPELVVTAGTAKSIAGLVNV